MRIPFYFWFPILMSLGIGFMTLSIPPVADQFSALLDVSYGGLSILFSAYYWTHVLVQVPAGLFSDRFGALLALRVSFSVTLACMLAPLLAPGSFALAFMGRFVLGACVAVFFLASVKVTKLIAPPAHIARVQGAQGAAFSLGTMLPYLVLPWFGSIGWVASYGISALFCVSLLYAVRRLPLRAMRRTRHAPALGEAWKGVKTIAMSGDVWFIGCCHGLALGSMLSVIGSWLPSILMDRAPGTTIETWALAVSFLLLTGTCGRVLGGEAARRMHRGLLINRIMLVVGVSYLVLAFCPLPALLIATGFFMTLLCGMVYASAFTLAIDTAEPGMLTTKVGFMNMIGNLVGGLVLIMFLGLFRDLTGSFAPGLCLFGVLALVFWFVTRRLAARLDPR